MNTQIIVDRISDLCKEKSVSINQMLKETNLNKSLVDNLKKGSMPSIDKMECVADYFGVSVDYLLGKTEAAEPDTPALSPEKQKILDACENLSPEQLEKVVEYVEFITAKKRSGD